MHMKIDIHSLLVDTQNYFQHKKQQNEIVQTHMHKRSFNPQNNRYHLGPEISNNEAGASIIESQGEDE